MSVPLLILAGMSGVGKTAVARAIVAADSRFTLLRSATTRPPRGDGLDSEYIYMTEEEFSSAAEKGEFAETAKYSGHMYGTLRSEIQAAAEQGRIPLLVLEFKGVESLVCDLDYNVCAVYIYANIRTAADRLLDRIGLAPDGRRPLAWVIRSERNVLDCFSHSLYARYFYGTAQNLCSVEDCRDSVITLFDDFLEGKPSDTEEIDSVFLSLTAEAMKIVRGKQKN